MAGRLRRREAGQLYCHASTYLTRLRLLERLAECFRLLPKGCRFESYLRSQPKSSIFNATLTQRAACPTCV